MDFKLTVAFVQTPTQDKVAIYRNDLMIQLFAPVPHTGSLAFLIEILTGQAPDIIMVKDMGEPIPNKLSDLRRWPEIAVDAFTEQRKGQPEALIASRIKRVLHRREPSSVQP